MPPTKKRPISRSYWLKCWRENSPQDTAGVWRFSLEDPRTGERVGFASLRALTAFLESKIRMWSAPEGEPPAREAQYAEDVSVS